MAGKKDLKILITASLNEALSKKEIQGKLDKIAPDLKLEVGLNTDSVKKMTEQFETLAKTMKTVQDKTNQLNNTKIDVVGNVDKINISAYERLQAKANEIKKSAKELVEVTMQTGNSVDDIQRATITYMDKKNNTIKEIYKLNSETNDWEHTENVIKDKVKKTEEYTQKVRELFKTIDNLETGSGFFTSNERSGLFEDVGLAKNMDDLKKIEKKIFDIQKAQNEMSDAFQSTFKTREQDSQSLKSNQFKAQEKNKTEEMNETLKAQQEMEEALLLTQRKRMKLEQDLKSNQFKSMSENSQRQALENIKAQEEMEKALLSTIKRRMEEEQKIQSNQMKAIQDNTAKQKIDDLKVQEQMQQMILQTIKKRQESEREIEENQQKAIQKNTDRDREEEKRVKESIETQKKSLEQRLKIMESKKEISKEEFTSLNSGLFDISDQKALDDYRVSLEGLLKTFKNEKRETEELSKAKKNLAMELLFLKKNSKLTQEQFDHFADSMDMKSSVDQVKLLTKELSNIKKLTQEEFQVQADKRISNQVNMLKHMYADVLNNPSGSGMKKEIEDIELALKSLNRNTPELEVEFKKLENRLFNIGVKGKEALKNVDLQKKKDEVIELLRASKDVGLVPEEYAKAMEQTLVNEHDIDVIKDYQREISAIRKETVGIAKVEDKVDKSLDSQRRTLLNKLKLLEATNVITKKQFGNITEGIDENGIKVFDGLFSSDDQEKLDNFKIGMEVMLKEIKKTNKEAEEFEIRIVKLTNEIDLMYKEGKLTFSQFKRLIDDLEFQDGMDDLDEFERRLRKTRRYTEEELDRAKDKINNMFRQTEGSHPKMFGNDLFGNLKPASRDLLELKERLHGVTNEMDDHYEEIQNITIATKKWQTQTIASAGANEKAGMTIREMMETAMTKFPVWMMASTAFYAPLQMLQSAIQGILEVDKQMTEFQRVSDGVINTKDVLKESADIADRLGNKMIEINNAMTGFARQGDFSQEQISKMAEVATLMSNVSDLSVDDSTSNLTSAMKAFGIEAEDTINIVDKLNEVKLISLPL